MNSKNSVRTWLDLRGLAVTIPSEGKRVGTVEDFYFDPESNEVYALRVNAGIYGYKGLTTNAISTIEPDQITVANDEMLIDPRNDGRLPILRLGRTLLSYKVKNENGDLVGTVANVLLNTYPPVALRITAFTLAGGRTFSANEITHYGRDEIVILNQVARAL